MSGKGKLERFLTPVDEHTTTAVGDTIPKGYVEFYNTIGASIDKRQNIAREKLDTAMNVVLDGNLYSLEGFSSDEAIEKVQKKAGKLMAELHKNEGLCELDTVSLNSTLDIALDVPDDRNQIYLQAMYETKEGDFASIKPSNFVQNVLAHPSKILMSLKAIYLLNTEFVEKELLSFVWVFLDVILYFTKNSIIKIPPEYVVVTLYIQKYALPFIKEDDLISLIKEKKLKFSLTKLNDLKLTEQSLHEIITALSSIGVIKIDSENISLSEKILLKVTVGMNT